MADPRAKDPDSDPPRRRRARYRGTHPRRFDERYKEHRAQQYPDIVEQVRARGGTPAGTHVPILLPEVIETLAPQPGERVADCTLGYGGHAAEILRRVGPTGALDGFDLDAQQLEQTGSRLHAEFPAHTIVLHHGNFAGVAKEAGERRFDIVFADLGVSSMQIDDPARGFSYKHDGPLDMRMDRNRRRSAADLLKTLDEAALATALGDLSQEPDAARVARTIVAARQREPITHTHQLARIVLDAKGLSSRGWREELSARLLARGDDSGNHPDRMLHPAARTFQALRILVNDELASLAQLLRMLPYTLAPGGRVGIITFHSGEDDLVAAALATGFESGEYQTLSTEPIRPGSEEKYNNPRSRSARFRWAQRATQSSPAETNATVE